MYMRVVDCPFEQSIIIIIVMAQPTRSGQGRTDFNCFRSSPPRPSCRAPPPPSCLLPPRARGLGDLPSKARKSFRETEKEREV